MAETSRITQAILTGHSRGLGAAIARELTNQHIQTLCLSRGSLNNKHLLLHEIQIDLADSQALQNWLHTDTLKTFCEKADTILLINNAGVVTPVGSFEHQDIGQVADAVALNVSAALVLSAAVYQAKKADTELRIMHISSGAARRAYPGWSTYCATKAALDMHAQCVAEDQLPDVKICSIAPGVIDTDMQRLIRNTPAEVFPDREKFENLKTQNQLTPADACAKGLLDFMLKDVFGKQVLADLRSV